MRCRRGHWGLSVSSVECTTAYTTLGRVCGASVGGENGMELNGNEVTSRTPECLTIFARTFVDQYDVPAKLRLDRPLQLADRRREGNLFKLGRH